MNRPDAPAGRLRLDNVAIAVGDLDAMIAWYRRVFGLAVAERGSFDAVGADYALLEGAGFRIELVSRGAPGVPVDRTPPPGHLHVLGYKALVFDADDLPAVTCDLEAAGIEIVWADVALSPGRRSTLIRDPEGNLINTFGPEAAARERPR